MSLEWLKISKTLKEIDEECNEHNDKEPVDIKTIEDVIVLITAAQEVNCVFELEFLLEIGNFIVKSDNFKGIKLLKANKTQEERLIITYTDALLVMDTTINTKHIVGVNFRLTFNDKFESD